LLLAHLFLHISRIRVKEDLMGGAYGNKINAYSSDRKTAAGHSEYLEINGRLLKFVWACIDWINLLRDGNNWTRFLTSEQKFCECCTEHFSSLNVGNFLTKQATVNFFKDSGPWRK
jgi:hypothetical protein